MTNSSAVAQPIVAAYFPEWGVYGRDYQVADIPADNLTHLIYAFTKIDNKGKIALYDEYAAIDRRVTNPADAVGGVADSYYYAPGDPRANQTVFGNFNQIAQLKALHPNLRTSVAIGGWTLSGNFSTTLDTATEREIFNNSVIDFLKKYPVFDGVDFDWEYPGGGGLDGNSASAQDGVNYAATLQDLRSKLDILGQETGRYFEISVASPAGVDKIPGMNLPELTKYVDFYNLMSYDFHGTWENSTGHQSALTGDSVGYDISTAVNAYLNSGVPADKIVLGSPLYTRAWTGVQSSHDDYGVADYGYKDSSAGAATGTFEKGNYDYKDILKQYQAGGWKMVWDDNAQAAYLWNPTSKTFSSFETPGTVALKSAWAREKGLRGMMFWDLSNDATGDKNSLLKAGSDYWLQGKSFEQICAASGLKFDYVVGGNGVFDLAQVLNDPNFAKGMTSLTPTPTPTPIPVPDPTPVPTPTPTPTPPPIDNATGRVFLANPAADDIVGFDPSRDRIDFGAITVHNLIIAKTQTGEVAIVNPWADIPKFQVLRGISYRDLTMANFGVVQNEHLRQDIGGVLSWEQNIGPRNSGTVYVRSHEYGVQQRMEGFNPATTKLSFLYFGTRERLSVTDTAEGLLISTLPTNQSILLVGMTKAKLVPGNVEFHHDQIVEDGLAGPFGHPANHFTLVSRTSLLTPTAPAGQVTDGYQTSIGLFVSGVHDHGTMPIPGGHSHGAMPMPTPTPTPVNPSSSGITASLTLTSQWSGTFEGTVILKNNSGSAVSQWSTTFNSRYQLRNISDFTVTQTQLADKTWQVTLKPPSWGSTIGAGASVSSYVQGAIPQGVTVSASDLIVGQSAPAVVPVAPDTPVKPADPISGTATPLAPKDPLTNPLGKSVVNVGLFTTSLTAVASSAETFALSYAWGRQLTIDGFDAKNDVIDLRGFWGEAKGAIGVATTGGTAIDLAFNAQRIFLPGVDASQLNSSNFLI